jgi:hypothetical protein
MSNRTETFAEVAAGTMVMEVEHKPEPRRTMVMEVGHKPEPRRTMVMEVKHARAAPHDSDGD